MCGLLSLPLTGFLHSVSRCVGGFLFLPFTGFFHSVSRYVGFYLCPSRVFSIQCVDMWVVFSAIYRFFSTRAAQQCAIDAAFLDLIPEHYSNVAKQAKVSAECRSRVNPLHRCAGPAIISVRVSHPFLGTLCTLLGTLARAHAHTHTHTHTRAHLCMHVYMHTHTHTLIYACAHACMHTHTYVCLHTHTRTRTHTHLYVHMRTYTHTQTYTHKADLACNTVYSTEHFYK